MMLGRCSQLFYKTRQFCVRCRTLLSSAFVNDLAWEQRLSNPAFSVLSANDLSVKLHNNLAGPQGVSHLDIDILVNKMNEFDLGMMDFFERIISSFQKTQAALQKLDSTHHALVRGLLGLGEQQRLLNWLADRKTYGLFLDAHSACLCLDFFIKQEDFASASSAAFHYAVQEDWSSSLTNQLILYSCCRRLRQLFDSETGKFIGRSNQTSETEDDEEIHVVTDIIRPNHYDDHFDISDPILQLGKTLFLLGDHFEKQSPRTALACIALGLSLYEKFEDLIKLNVFPLKKEVGLSPEEVQSIVGLSKSITDEVELLGEGAQNAVGERAKPSGKQLGDLQALMSDSSSHPLSFHILDVLESSALQEIKELEPQEKTALEARYQTYNRIRSDALQKETQRLESMESFAGVKKQLKELTDEEEYLTFFEKKTEIDYAAWLAPRVGDETKVRSRKLWQRDLAKLRKPKKRPKFQPLEE